MSGAFRRISQVFTPPPKRPPEPETKLRRAEPKMLVSEVRPFVDAFLNAEDMDSEEAHAAQKEILSVAKTCGLYLAASEIYAYVSRLRRTDSKGEPTNRERGYELAGELYFLKLREQIDSFENEARPFGPAIFKDYCNELFDCFFNSNHVRKGVSFPIWLMERLIDKAITAWEFRELYLALAEEALESAREMSVQKADKDQRNKQRDSRLRRKGKIEDTQEVNPEREIDPELIQYLDNVRQRFTVIKQSLLEYPLAPPVDGNGPEVVNAHVEFLYGLLKIAEKAGYLGVSALLKEKVGLRLKSSKKEQANTFLNAAANDYVRLGDHERRLLLMKLCSRRYHKACELYTSTSAKKNAQAVTERIDEVKRTYDAHLLTIAQL